MLRANAQLFVEEGETGGKAHLAAHTCIQARLEEDLEKYTAVMTNRYYELRHLDLYVIRYSLNRHRHAVPVRRNSL